jgi:hypothetical protein
VERVRFDVTGGTNFGGAASADTSAIVDDEGLPAAPDDGRAAHGYRAPAAGLMVYDTDVDKLYVYTTSCTCIRRRCERITAV